MNIQTNINANGIAAAIYRQQVEQADALCEDMDEDKAQIIAALAVIGYEYNEATNQFI